MKKQTLILIVAILLFGAAIAAALWMQKQSHETTEPEPATESETIEGEEDQALTTNSVIYFEDETPEADPLLVGHWTNTENTGWHKVYYDDYDGDGRFWGKEWDESEDVLEEDLSYHGNGWFRWEKHDDTLQELYTMDTRDVPIAHTYLILVHDSTDIEQIETYNRSTHRFIKQ